MNHSLGWRQANALRGISTPKVKRSFRITSPRFVRRIVLDLCARYHAVQAELAVYRGEMVFAANHEALAHECDRKMKEVAK